MIDAYQTITAADEPGRSGLTPLPRVNEKTRVSIRFQQKREMKLFSEIGCSVAGLGAHARR